MITVWLYGVLAEQFGDKYELDVKSPSEAVLALEANNPGKFKQALVGNKYQISRGETFEGGEGDTIETLTLQRMNQDIHFVPVIEGSGGGGLFQTILGVALLAVSFAVPAFIWLRPLAIGLALGGVVQMLSPVNTLSQPSGYGGGAGLGGVTENIDPRKSFIFTGAQNILTQGGCVPICYGEFEVGSVVISQSLIAERI